MIMCSCGPAKLAEAERRIPFDQNSAGASVAFSTVGKVNIIDVSTQRYESLPVGEMNGVNQSLVGQRSLLVFQWTSIRLVNLYGGKTRTFYWDPSPGAAGLSNDLQRAATIGIEDSQIVVRTGLANENPLREIYRVADDHPHRWGTVTWAPDNQRFAFSTAGKVFVFDTTSATLTQVAEGSFPDWAPDGRQIAMRRPDGQAALVIAQPPWRQFPIPSVRPLWAARWSPNNQYLLFSRKRSLWELRLSTCASTTVLSAYALADGATQDIYPLCMGADDRNFFWIKTDKSLQPQ
jgi:WD40 repeat protein